MEPKVLDNTVYETVPNHNPNLVVVYCQCSDDVKEITEEMLYYTPIIAFNCIRQSDADGDDNDQDVFFYSRPITATTFNRMQDDVIIMDLAQELWWGPTKHHHGDSVDELVASLNRMLDESRKEKAA